MEQTIKRYVLFSNECYYPSGGWDDRDGSYETLLEAIDAASIYLASQSHRLDMVWAHVVDLEKGEVVWKS